MVLRSSWVLSGALVAALASACVGSLGGDDVAGVEPPSAEAMAAIGESGARRLTAAEYDATVRDLLGVTTTASTAFEDARTPFDNDYTIQVASESLISTVEQVAGDVAGEVVASSTLRDAAVGCTPSGVADEACFRSFVETFGRRALRRPLTAEEVERFVAQFMPHATQGDDFYVAVDSALRAFLQHPEFLYRVERGTPVDGYPGVFRLSDFELATRMAYTLLGSTPPDWLLDAAQAGELASEEGVRAAATRLLEDDRALPTITRFHAMWLGYEQMPVSADLAADMQQETQALLEKVLLVEKRAWSEVLKSEETYLTPTLADHYDLTAPSGEAGWVDYGDSGRRGLLSHGTFLSSVAKFDDTSPTQRGLLIRTRLFCEVINPPPPDLMVDVDNPPEGSDPNACKLEKYDMWKTDGCKLCHQYLEPVGFGLENYDMTGRYRETEPDRPDCAIDGQGELEGIGTFSGPRELADLMLEAGDVDSCVTRQLVRFAAGRFDLDGYDQAFIEQAVAAASDDEGMHFDRLLVEVVSAEAFRHRREEEVSP